ncbi:MAG: multiheme c-type cytochrome [Planctomycetaceae bacterium]
MSATTPETAHPAPTRARKAYVPAVGPGLRKLLFAVFALVALLGANSAYLAGVTFLSWWTDASYEDQFYLWMFLAHLVLGLLLVLPVVIFAVLHLLRTRQRKNRRAVRVGYALFAVTLTVLATGLLLVRLEGLFDLKLPAARATTVYWLHVACPLAAAWLYWLHRLAGPRIHWRIGGAYLAVVGGMVGGMIVLHAQDPRKWNEVGSADGLKYFQPSRVVTSTGKFIPAQALMMDHYCKKCHGDVHARWNGSAHRFSSFNNPAYLVSVRETRHVSMMRSGNVKASRWCAGCHDPVPFLSGQFDDPDFDDVKNPTAHAGITCTTCHAVTNINSTRGNGDYTIEEPLHYPFAYSENPFLQWVNNQLVKAKPSFHKKTFLKPLHKTTEFCSVCHKVNLPTELTEYAGFIRGQNHHDSFLLSGVSGGGVRSFYYPPKAEQNCNGCHMPLRASDDFAAKDFDGSGELKVHDHLFLGANTGIAWLKNHPVAQTAHEEFLKGSLRVDIFGLKEGGTITGRLHAPLRQENSTMPVLDPGKTYLLETVLRTLRVGHHFTQGTVDSNEIWLDVMLKAGNHVIGRSGGMDDCKEVDRWSHFVNVFLLDRHGNRINRRNAQDIFFPLYNHQMPPGTGQTVHYGFRVPPGITQPLTVTVKLRYRKFDREYMAVVANSLSPRDKPLRGNRPGKPYVNGLPIVTIAEDSVTFPVRGGPLNVKNDKPDVPAWQRWNDYGIGLLLKTKSGTNKSAELKQAAAAFREVEKLGRYDGPLNLARVLLQEAGEGQLEEAVEAVNRAAAYTNPSAPPWTLAWFRAVVLRQHGRLEEAERNLRSFLDVRTAEMKRRGFDFRRDYIAINLLGETLIQRANRAFAQQRKNEGETLLREAVQQFRKTLAIDAENHTAHFNLQLVYALLGEKKLSEKHALLAETYNRDDGDGSEAIGLARIERPLAEFVGGVGAVAGSLRPMKQKPNPAGDFAADEPVIYWLHRPGAPRLPKAWWKPDPRLRRE